MTIGNASSGRYLWNQSTLADFTGPTIRLGLINMPSFDFLLSADNTLSGTIQVQVANSIDNNFGPTFDALVWVPIYSIAIAAGVFTTTSAKYFMFPDSLFGTIDFPYFTGAEAIRLVFVHSGGSTENLLNVAYFGKSYG